MMPCDQAKQGVCDGAVLVQNIHANATLDAGKER